MALQAPSGRRSGGRGQVQRGMRRVAARGSQARGPRRGQQRQRPGPVRGILEGGAASLRLLLLRAVTVAPPAPSSLAASVSLAHLAHWQSELELEVLRRHPDLAPGSEDAAGGGGGSDLEPEARWRLLERLRSDVGLGTAL